MNLQSQAIYAHKKTISNNVYLFKKMVQVVNKWVTLKRLLSKTCSKYDFIT